jgi:hypothetical protein
MAGPVHARQRLRVVVQVENLRNRLAAHAIEARDDLLGLPHPARNPSGGSRLPNAEPIKGSHSSIRSQRAFVHVPTHHPQQRVAPGKLDR